MGKNKCLKKKLEELEDKVTFLTKRINKKDPEYYVDQWHLRTLGVEEAWNKGITGRSVVVGVVDHSIDDRHPDLEIRKDLGYVEDVGNVINKTHGTMVSGIIGARGNKYCYGIAPQCQLASYAFFSDNRLKSIEKLSQEFDKLDIINNSWGFNFFYGNIVSIEEIKTFERNKLLLETLYKFAKNGRKGKGGIVCFATGNEKEFKTFNKSYYNQKEFIVVIAVSKSLKITSHSTIGAGILCSAPSGPRFDDEKSELGIVTTLSGSKDLHPITYAMNGTSASCPMVSGVIALMLDYRPDLTVRDVKEVLSRGCVYNIRQGNSKNGAGRYHNLSYGFGIPYIPKIMEILNTWKLLPQEITVYKEVSVNNIDFQNDSKTFEITVDEDITIENVQLFLRTDGEGDIYDFILEVTSPSDYSLGVITKTDKIEKPVIGEENTDDFKDDPVLIEGFRGEKSKGTWKIKISDEVPKLEKDPNDPQKEIEVPEIPKILKSLKMYIYGH